MIYFPPCKINIGLHVTSKRADGFHAIESIFYPVQWNDVLEIVPAPKAESTLHLSGQNVTINSNDNIAWKALQLIQQDYPNCHADIHLYKNIPSGAGLGGGSSDGAQTLVMLNRVFDLQLSNTQLEAYAAQLGSDCPFFVQALPTYVEGRGEIMTPHPLNLKGLTIVIVHPKLHVSTAEAYGLITPKPSHHRLTELSEVTIADWKSFVTNDFEMPVMQKYPEIQKVKSELYEIGAVYASMSGSGSAVFGIFQTPPLAKIWPSHYHVYQGIL